MRRYRFAAVLLAGLSLVGCGKKRRDPQSSAVQEYSAVIVDETKPVQQSTLPETTAAPDSTAPETSAQTTYETSELTETTTLTVEAVLDKNGVYTTKDDVALYLYTYGELPSNFITKKEAQKLGWEGGSLEPYAPGKCIGGSRFGNYEGILPEKDGRSYTECDIDTLGKNSRGAKRIVFSNDGLIYYTGDHYKTFELLYGEE